MDPFCSCVPSLGSCAPPKKIGPDFVSKPACLARHFFAFSKSILGQKLPPSATVTMRRIQQQGRPVMSTQEANGRFFMSDSEDEEERQQEEELSKLYGEAAESKTNHQKEEDLEKLYKKKQRVKKAPAVTTEQLTDALTKIPNEFQTLVTPNKNSITSCAQYTRKLMERYVQHLPAVDIQRIQKMGSTAPVKAFLIAQRKHVVRDVYLKKVLGDEPAEQLLAQLNEYDPSPVKDNDVNKNNNDAAESETPNASNAAPATAANPYSNNGIHNKRKWGGPDNNDIDDDEELEFQDTNNSKTNALPKDDDKFEFSSRRPTKKAIVDDSDEEEFDMDFAVAARTMQSRIVDTDDEEEPSTKRDNTNQPSVEENLDTADNEPAQNEDDDIEQVEEPETQLLTTENAPTKENDQPHPAPQIMESTPTDDEDEPERLLLGQPTQDVSSPDTTATSPNKFPSPPMADLDDDDSMDGTTAALSSPNGPMDEDATDENAAQQEVATQSAFDMDAIPTQQEEVATQSALDMDDIPTQHEDPTQQEEEIPTQLASDIDVIPTQPISDK